MALRKPNTRYQYDPLVTPPEWKGDEQRFAIRLKGILDDLYQKVGSLRNRPGSENGGGLGTINPVQTGLYPVGMIILLHNSVDPNALWGGKWQLLDEGLTMVQAGTNYPLGSTGGEATHTLTVDEMPNHSHQQRYDLVGYSGWSGTTTYYTFSGYHNPGNTNSSTGVAAQYTASTGGSKPHNNMPPYLAVNIWMRVA